MNQRVAAPTMTFLTIVHEHTQQQRYMSISLIGSKAMSVKE